MIPTKPWPQPSPEWTVSWFKFQTNCVTDGRDDTSELLLLFTSYHSITTMTGRTERKLNPEQSDCNISQDDRSLVSFPNKAESTSHLFLCLPWLLPCWLLPVPFCRRGTSQVHYRNQTLRHRTFGDPVGDWPRRWGRCPVHTGCGASKGLCHETRWWNDPTVLRRFHLVCWGPRGQARHAAWATRKVARHSPERGQALPHLPAKSGPLVERPPPGASCTSRRLVQPWASLSQAVRLLVISPSLPGRDGCTTTVRARRGGYISSSLQEAFLYPGWLEPMLV